jgi:hypothetical protein
MCFLIIFYNFSAIEKSPSEKAAKGHTDCLYTYVRLLQIEEKDGKEEKGR